MTTTTRLLTTFVLGLQACAPGPNDTAGSSTSDTTSTSETSSAASPTSTSDATSTTSTSDATSTTSTSDATSTTSTTSTSDAEGSTAVLTTATTDGPSGTCATDGGICVGADTCVQQGGSIAPSSPGGCSFDDVEAECCVPPPPKPGATTCTDTGGVCAPIGGCLAVGGYITSIDDGCEFQGLYACCVPHDRCGDQTFECCDGDAVYNPVCDEGVFACIAGDPAPIGTCL